MRGIRNTAKSGEDQTGGKYTKKTTSPDGSPGRHATSDPTKQFGTKPSPHVSAGGGHAALSLMTYSGYVVLLVMCFSTSDICRPDSEVQEIHRLVL